MLSIGSHIPKFSAQNQDGQEVTQDNLQGWNILYFYPRDETPGCTAQACSLRDSFAAIEAKGVTVYGISPDSVRSHRKFADHHSLPFTLLADPEHKMIETFDLWVEKSMFGKKYMGVERSTYIIAPDGTVAAAYPKVNPIGHAGFLLDELARLL